MSIFGKSDEDSTSVEALTALQLKLEKAESELKELRLFKAKQDELAQLVSKSEELGFQGKVEDLLGSNPAESMSNLITAYTTQLTQRQADFTEGSSDEDQGDSTDHTDEVVINTKNEALKFVKAEHNLSGKAAVEKAMSLYPKLWGGQ